MNHRFARSQFESRFVRNCDEGYAGFELYQSQDGQTKCVAKVIYWDACGQFFIETLGTDVHVEIIEELIAEAKSVIKTG